MQDADVADVPVEQLLQMLDDASSSVAAVASSAAVLDEAGSSAAVLDEASSSAAAVDYQSLHSAEDWDEL